jgi:hypothetical protein
VQTNFFFFVLEAARLATDKAQPSTPSIGIARLTSAQKRERSALRKSPSRAVKIVKRRHRPVQRYTLKQAVLELQTELVTASQLKEIRYNRSQSLQDNVVEFTTKEITTALERAAPNVFGLLTGAYGKCARSGRPIQEGEADDARTFAATHLALLLKACNQRCDRVSKMMTLALMSKDTNKSVRLRLFLSTVVLTTSRLWNFCIRSVLQMTAGLYWPWRRNTPRRACKSCAIVYWPSCWTISTFLFLWEGLLECST